MIETLKEGKGYHKLHAPAKVMEYTTEYRNDNDGIARFISERITTFEEGETGAVTKDTLRNTFKHWKGQNEQLTLSIADLEKRIIELYGKHPRGGWSNFKIVDV
jgi:phage/plasmid-associated DNA primase